MKDDNSGDRFAIPRNTLDISRRRLAKLSSMPGLLLLTYHLELSLDFQLLWNFYTFYAIVERREDCLLRLLFYNQEF